MKKYTPVWIIAQKEFRILYRERVVVLLSLFIWILLAVGVYTGIEQLRITTLQREKATDTFRHEWEEQETNPHAAAHFGTWLYKPDSYLSIYEPGLNQYQGISYRVEAHIQHEADHASAQASDGQMRFGELSVALVLHLLVPLFILFIGFNSFTREREGNTLRLLITQGMDTRQLIWGKVMGHYALVLTIMLPAFLMMALPLMMQHAHSDDLLRYGVLVLVMLTFYFVVTCIAILASIWSKSSAAALITCIGIWFFSAVVAPRITVGIADDAYPLPSRAEFNRNVTEGYRNGLNGDGNTTERYQRLLDSTLKANGVDSAKQLRFNFDGFVMQSGEDYKSKVYGYYAGLIEQQSNRQQQLLAVAGFFDPFMAVRQLSMTLAGSDHLHHRSFSVQARQYRNQFIRLLNMELANSGSAYLTYDYKVGHEFFKKMKSFSYDAPHIGQAIRWTYVAWAGLGIWCLLIWLLVQISSHRLLKI